MLCITVLYIYFFILYFSLYSTQLGCLTWKSYFSDDSLAVSDMLFNTHFTSALVCPSSESLHPFVNFPLASEVIALLSCHSTVNFTSFHTLWAQKSGHLDRYFSLMRSINRAASVELGQYYH